MSHRDSRRGFTLLEVVVAVAILGVGVAVSMQIFSGGLRNLHRIDLAHRAMAHAENVMSDLLADDSIRGPYQLSDDLDEDFSFEATIDYWNEPDQGLRPLQSSETISLLGISVQVNFKNNENRRVYRTFCFKAVSEQAAELDVKVC